MVTHRSYTTEPAVSIASVTLESESLQQRLVSLIVIRYKGSLSYSLSC